MSTILFNASRIGNRNRNAFAAGLEATPEATPSIPFGPVLPASRYTRYRADRPKGRPDLRHLDSIWYGAWTLGYDGISAEPTDGMTGWERASWYAGYDAGLAALEAERQQAAALFGVQCDAIRERYYCEAERAEVGSAIGHDDTMTEGGI